jgi:tetratricopeptide (TPR) repeat protein
MTIARGNSRKISVLVLSAVFLALSGPLARAGEGKVVGYYSQDGKLISGETAEEAFNKAEKYYSQKAYDEAIAEYTTAIEINPNYAKAYTKRGVAYASKGDNEQAEKDLSRAIELDPNNPNAYFERMMFYQILTGKEDAAQKDSDKYLQLLKEKEGGS